MEGAEAIAGGDGLPRACAEFRRLDAQAPPVRSDRIAE